MAKDGCKYFQKCDDCPTEKCYEEYTKKRIYIAKMRNICIKILYDKGYSALSIAKMFDLNDITVRRAIK